MLYYSQDKQTQHKYMNSFQDLLAQRKAQVKAMEAIAPSMEVIQNEMLSIEDVIDPIILKDVKDCLIEDIRFLGSQSGKGQAVETLISNEILPTAFSYGLDVPTEGGADVEEEDNLPTHTQYEPDGNIPHIYNDGKYELTDKDNNLLAVGDATNFPEVPTEQEVTLETTEITPETVVGTNPQIDAANNTRNAGLLDVVTTGLVPTNRPRTVFDTQPKDITIGCHVYDKNTYETGIVVECPHEDAKDETDKNGHYLVNTGQPYVWVSLDGTDNIVAVFVNALQLLVDQTIVEASTVQVESSNTPTITSTNLTTEEDKPTKRNKRRTQKQFDCLVNKLSEELPRVQTIWEFEELKTQIEEFTGDGKYTLPDDLLEDFNKEVEYWSNKADQNIEDTEEVQIEISPSIAAEPEQEITEALQNTQVDESQPELNVEQAFISRLTSNLSETGSGDLWEEIRQHYGSVSAIPEMIAEAFSKFYDELQARLSDDDDGEELEIYEGYIPEEEELATEEPQAPEVAATVEQTSERTVEDKNLEWQEAIASAKETDLAAWDVWVTNQLNDRNPEILPATYQALQSAKAKFTPVIEKPESVAVTAPATKYSADEAANLNKIWLESAEKVASSESYTKEDVDYIWAAIRVSDIDRTLLSMQLINKLTFLQNNVPAPKAVETVAPVKEAQAAVVEQVEVTPQPVATVAETPVQETQPEPTKPAFSLFGGIKIQKSIAEVASDETSNEPEQVTEEVARESITPNFVATVNPQPQQQPTATNETAKTAVNFNMANFGGGGIKRSSATVATELSETEGNTAPVFEGIRVTQNVKFQAYPAGSGTEPIARDSREYIIPVGTLGLHPKTDSLFVVVTWEEALDNNAAIKETLDIESTKDNFTVIPVKFTEPTPQYYLPLPPEECCVIDAAEFERIRSIQQKWIDALSNGKAPFDDDDVPF